jgi:hypothetical protein
MFPYIINIVQKGEAGLQKQLLLVFLGWLLGVSGTIIMTVIARNRSRKEMASLFIGQIENNKTALEQDLGEIPKGQPILRTIASPLYLNTYNSLILNVYANNLHLFSHNVVNVLISYGVLLNKIQHGKEIIRKIMDEGHPPAHLDLCHLYTTQITLTQGALELSLEALGKLRKEAKIRFRFAL